MKLQNESETDYCRELLAPYCVGNGLDIGAGGSPIVPSAICIDREEGSVHRAYVGSHPTHLVWDAFHRLPFDSFSLDYCFSSHCLEDAQETAQVLEEWMRVLKVGGKLVLYLPDQKRYEEDCERKGWLPNQDHVHKDMGLEYIKSCLASIKPRCPYEIIQSLDPFEEDSYSFSIVVQKL